MKRRGGSADALVAKILLIGLPLLCGLAFIGLQQQILMNARQEDCGPWKRGEDVEEIIRQSRVVEQKRRASEGETVQVVARSSELGQRCDSMLVSGERHDFAKSHSCPFPCGKVVIVRTIGNDRNAVQDLPRVLDIEETFSDVHNHWILDRIIDVSTVKEISSILVKHNQRFTVVPVDLGPLAEATLNIPENTEKDILHLRRSFSNLEDRILKPKVFQSIYADKISVLSSMRRQSPPGPQLQDWLAGVWRASCTPFFVQWGANCALTAKVWDVLKAQLVPSQQVSTTNVPVPAVWSISSSSDEKGGPKFAEITQQLLMPLEESILLEREHFSSSKFTFYNEERLLREREAYEAFPRDSSLSRLIGSLVSLADKALQYGPWSVTDKPDCSLLPSCHEYYSRAPYAWPPPKNNSGGKQWISRDGYRIPGSELHDPESYKYDRTRVNAMKFNTTILALAWFFTGEEAYAEAGARNVRTWFLDESTKMNPRLTYAQVRHWIKIPDGYHGTFPGHIDWKDLYFFMDAIRLLLKSKALSEETDKPALESWFRKYLGWIKRSEPGKSVFTGTQNHGTFYDMQLVTVAAFASDLETIVTSLPWVAARLFRQVDPHTGGGMPGELKRPNCMHYQMFTLQGWVNLARISKNLGIVNLWTVRWSSNGESVLCKAIEFALPMYNNGGDCSGNIRNENQKRWWPIFVEAKRNCPNLAKTAAPNKNNTSTVTFDMMPPEDIYEMPNRYYQHDGIAYFWNLGV